MCGGMYPVGSGCWSMVKFFPFYFQQKSLWSESKDMIRPFWVDVSYTSSHSSLAYTQLKEVVPWLPVPVKCHLWSSARTLWEESPRPKVSSNPELVPERWWADLTVSAVCCAWRYSPWFPLSPPGSPSHSFASQTFRAWFSTLQSTLSPKAHYLERMSY